MNVRVLTLAVVLAVAAAIAGGLYLGSRGEETGAQPTTPGSAAAGSQLAMPRGKIGAQGLSIAEARTAETPENLLVRGYLVTQETGLALCETPSCEGDRLTVDGEPGIEPDGPEAVMLLGTVEGDRIVAVNLASS